MLCLPIRSLLLLLLPIPSLLVVLLYNRPGYLLPSPPAPTIHPQRAVQLKSVVVSSIAKFNNFCLWQTQSKILVDNDAVTYVLTWILYVMLSNGTPSRYWIYPCRGGTNNIFKCCYLCFYNLSAHICSKWNDLNIVERRHQTILTRTSCFWPNADLILCKSFRNWAISIILPQNVTFELICPSLCLQYSSVVPNHVKWTIFCLVRVNKSEK